MADTYVNKYLDGVGLAYLWEKIKDQRAKIAQLDLSEDSLTLNNTNEGDQKYFSWLTSSSQDVMIEDTSDDSRRYYFVYKDKEDTLDAFNWQTFDSAGTVRVRAVKDGNILTITKIYDSYTDAYGHKLEDFLQAVQFSGSSINVKNGASTTELNIQVDNTNGTLTFKPNSSSTTSLVLNKITNATYATKLGNSTTWYEPEIELTDNSDSKIPTSKAVASYVTGKVAEIDQFKYVVSTDAATTPKDVKWEKASGQGYTTITGTLVAGASTEFIIYLVPATVGNSLLAESGSYVEYLTIKNGETYQWEQIGTTKADLSGYVTGTGLTSNKIILGNGSSGIKASTYSISGSITNDATAGTTIPTNAAIISYAQPKITVIGTATKPIYVNQSSEIKECEQYAGGTAVTFNGTSKAGDTASFYAPAGAGTANQVLISNGNNKAPSWVSQSDLNVGSATKATNDGDGNSITGKYVPYKDATRDVDLGEKALKFGDSFSLSDSGFNYTNTSNKIKIGVYGTDFEKNAITIQGPNSNNSNTNGTANQADYGYQGIYISTRNDTQYNNKKYEIAFPTLTENTTFVTMSMTLTTDDIEDIINNLENS